jgi:hypothetical protein
LKPHVCSHVDSSTKFNQHDFISRASRRFRLSKD